ncbi:HlyD family efflux transporter periplasmic adaptor subunit [Mucilaginibacter robiniae]|uniref:HlyD family efflux transporter periplasmic adaptor subunit n=1 Tax=Mucilaginibacter robiniae TaxID=2728022 RepID=A0A7L5DZ39_9SPHI|nr:efflux RND transporter periplasmic adaptor subunit [Mucilaginibacter robiniae]QJD96360.1 HlyD family efflux transporter periplasmic adaptor subunit [Mucilaginibacter robiniae]
MYIKHYSLLGLTALLILAGCQPKNLVKPQRKNIVDAVFGSGHIENLNQYTIMANAEGFIKKAYVAEGDTVKGGQPLFRLANDVQQTQVSNALTNLQYAETNTAQGSPQIEQLKIQIGLAKQRNRVDSANYQRYSRLIKTQAVSVTDFENSRLTYQNSLSNLHVLQKNLADLQRNLNLNLQNAKAQYKIQEANNNYYNLTSSGAGVVMNVVKKTGDYVRKGDAIALVGAGKPIAKLDIAENDIERIKVGQQTLISLNSDKNKVYEATITKIYPAFNTSEQAFIAEATFTNTPGNLLNGTQLQANIIIQKKKDALVIPSYYLQNGDYVFVQGSKEKKKVEAGIRTLEWTEITGGLSGNEELTLPKQQ